MATILALMSSTGVGAAVAGAWEAEAPPLEAAAPNIPPPVEAVAPNIPPVEPAAPNMPSVEAADANKPPEVAAVAAVGANKLPVLLDAAADANSPPEAAPPEEAKESKLGLLVNDGAPNIDEAPNNDAEPPRTSEGADDDAASVPSPLKRTPGADLFFWGMNEGGGIV